MRILSLTYHYVEDFVRILADAATPPPDRDALERYLRELDTAEDPRTLLAPLRERPGLLELRFVAPSSGHAYGMLFCDMGRVADAIAYWREPPLYMDVQSATPHGLSRAHALELALRRLEAPR